MLDVRIASAVNKILQNSNFKKKVGLAEWKAQKEDRLLRGRRGRQIAVMIFEDFQLTGGHEAVLGCHYPFRISLHGDDSQDFRRCEHESLINSEQYCVCTNKKLIKISRGVTI